MSNILLLYEPKSDAAVLSGGNWRAALPLTNLQDRRPSRVARSTNAALESTTLRAAFPASTSFRALVLGPMNVTSGYRYRICTFSDAGFSTQVTATAWIKPFDGFTGERDWEDPEFWLGITPFDDAERGVFLIHDFGAPVASRYWQIEIDDTANPAGYVQIGRLFMPSAWQPKLNYALDANGLSFENNSRSAQNMSGGLEFDRRLNPRTFRAALPYLKESEAYSQAYRFFRVAGYDGEVFVIPDPADLTGIQQRSFMGTIRSMEPISQTEWQTAGTAFEIREII